jgi:C1A family cysteine protease
MSNRKVTLFTLVIILMVFGFSGAGLAQQLQKAPEIEYESPPENYGFFPPKIDMSYLTPSTGMFMAPAGSWDWRDHSGVSSVKNQNPYGTCWAFAAVGDYESKIMINNGYEPDYSEFNIQACNPTSNNCNYGGNAWMSTNYLALLGSVEETCDPYPGDCPSATCNNPSCSFLKQVIQWKVIPNNVTAIKNALTTYGPVYTTMYAGFPGFSSYDGSYCLTYTGSEDPNHAVLIVGYDDDMCSGNGGWIVKNSWGTGWGDNGFFYIEYENARIGGYSNVITGYKNYNPDETIYYYDEWGWWSSVGYGDGDDWGLVEITPTSDNEYLYTIDFWAVNGPTSYDIWVYDSFDGSNPPTSLLVGPISGTVQEAGYYSEELSTPLAVTNGDPIYIVIDFNTSPYGYPVPMDDSGPMETDKCYVSDSGTSWEALDNGGYAMGDVGIRARIGPEQEEEDCSIEGPSEWYGDPYGFPDTDDTYAGNVIEYGFAWCTDITIDTLCVWVEDTEGWTFGGDLDICFISDPGCWGTIYVTVKAPCDAEVCDYDTIYAHLSYCSVLGNCTHVPECIADTDTMIVHVVESPPALGILQDSLTVVTEGQTAAYIPFAICNQDPCAAPQSYTYVITSKGHVGGAINQGGSKVVDGGECENVYGVVDAGEAEPCDLDTLTIIAWDTATGEIYDTCVQLVHVVEVEPVPLFSTPVLTILVLAMILSAAVILRRKSSETA